MRNSTGSSASIRQYTVGYTQNYEKLYRIICKHQAIHSGIYTELWLTLQDHLQASGKIQWYIHGTMRNSTWLDHMQASGNTQWDIHWTMRNSTGSTANIRQNTVVYTQNYEKLYRINCKHQAIHNGIYMDLWDTLEDHLQASGNTQWDIQGSMRNSTKIIFKHQAFHSTKRNDSVPPNKNI